MSQRRKMYSFRINEAEAAGLKIVKEADGISESEQIRQAIRDWLDKKGVRKAASRRAATRRKA